MNDRQPRSGPARLVILAAATGVVATACAAPSQPAAAPASSAPAPSSTPFQTPSMTSRPASTPTVEAAAQPVRLPSLKGDTRNAIAFAPLDDPRDVTVRGKVPTANAWSTSKVLVVLAYIQTVADGDPRNLDSSQRDLIKRALTASDMDALLAIRGAIPGGSGAPMTAILRSIGDNRTTAPDSGEGSMRWTLRNQVRFMAALAAGDVVNKRTSRYVLNQMHPIPEHSWGLGRVGASNFKGGWLEPYTETRQMGIVDGYAVAIITTAGPAVVQTDGDSAHVRAINKLARTLKKYLRADAATR